MELLAAIIQFIAQGGSAAVIAILVAAVIVLIWDRRRIIDDLKDTTQLVYDAKDNEAKTIKEIVDRYHHGNVDLIQALNEIKIVLVTLQSSHRR